MLNSSQRNQMTQHSTKSKFLLFTYRFCMEAVVCFELCESNIEITVKFEIAHQSQTDVSLPDICQSVSDLKFNILFILYMCNFFFSVYSTNISLTS